MDIIEQMKNEQAIDKLIIYMLYYGMSKTDIAKRLGVSRGTIYNAIVRSEELLVTLKLLT